MENASKALIIAGAILISIIIIGLGVYFVNMAQQAGQGVNLDKQVVESHNNPFTAYFKNAASATDVKSLISEVRSNNLTATNSGDESTKIYLAYSDGSKWTITDQASSISGNIKTGKRYKISSKDVSNDTIPSGDSEPDSGYYKSGYIKVIQIELVKDK